MQASGIATMPGLKALCAGWRWWTGELASLIPAPWRNAFVFRDDVVVIDVADADFLVSRDDGTKRRVIARIPRDDFAVRALQLSAPRTKGARLWLADPVVLRLPADAALHAHLAPAACGPPGSRKHSEP